MISWERVGAFVAAQKMRVGTLALGHTVNALECYAFDYVLYPVVIYWLGLARGMPIMMALSAIVCLATFKFYDWAKQDWLGIELVKSQRDDEATTRVGRMTRWLLERSDPVALVGLSLLTDPFITTAYLRKGAHQYNGLAARDWWVFWASFVISNLSWGFAVFGGVSAFRALMDL